MKSQILFEIPPPSTPEVEPGHIPDFPEIPGNEPEEIPEEEPGKIPEEEPEKIPDEEPGKPAPAEVPKPEKK